MEQLSFSNFSYKQKQFRFVSEISYLPYEQNQVGFGSHW